MSLYPPPLQTFLEKPVPISEASSSNIYRYKSILKTGNTRSVLIPNKSPRARSKSTTLDVPVVPLSEHISDRVPRELIDYCFSFLQDEPHVLGTCALVCRVWHYLVNARRFRKPLALNVSERKPKVLALATNPSDSFTRHIAGLVVQLPNDAMTEIQQQLWLDQYVTPLITQARRLRSIALYNLSRGPPLHSAFSTISVQLEGLKHLRRLNLARCEFLNFRELVSVICAARRLQVLALSEVNMSEWKTNLSTSSFQISPHLTQLHLFAPIAGRLLHWFNSPRRTHMLKITSIHMSIPEGILEEHSAAGMFFKSLRQHLTCLRINLPMGRYISHIDLSENTQLQELSLTHCLIRSGGEGEASENADESGALMSLIRNVNTQNLRRISINFLHTLADITTFPWESLSKTPASTSNFPALMRVDISVKGRKAYRPDVRLGLIELSRRQLLRLVYILPDSNEED